MANMPQVKDSDQPGSRKTWFIAGACLLIASFLLGFIPQYVRTSHAVENVHARDQQIDRLQRDANLSRMRDLASLLYLQVTLKNYGIAAGHASAFFDLVRSTADSASDPTLKSGLESILAQRDEIVSKLAKPDAAVASDTAVLLDHLFQLTFKPQN